MIDQMNKWISPDPEFFAWPGSESLRHLFWGRWQQVRLRCPNEKHGTGCCIIYIFCFPATGIRHPAPASGTGNRHPATGPPASGTTGTGIRHRASGTRHRHPVSASGTGIHAATGTRHPAPGSYSIGIQHRPPASVSATDTGTGHLAPAIP